MATKKDVAAPREAGLALYLKRVFAIMFGAVGLTAVSSYLSLRYGLPLIVNAAGTGYSALFYIVMFGAFFLAIWAQVRAFSLKASTGALLLGIYAVAMGFVISPLVAFSLAVNPVSVIQAFVIAALMFACMALFGYKTAKDLSFMGKFLFMGMIGLILVGIASFVWPLGSTLSTIVCAIGVLVFALFTAYDMQFLKRAYDQVGKDHENQLAVLGALHLYISFIAMFQYILSLLNLSRN